MNSIIGLLAIVWVFIAQMVEHCSANAEATGSNPVKAPKNFLSGYFAIAIQLRWSHLHSTCISAVHNSPYSMFHSFHGLMNSINWSASSVWVFIAQLVEHCSANAEATGSNPFEAPKKCFRPTSQLLKLRFNCDGHIFIS